MRGSGSKLDQNCTHCKIFAVQSDCRLSMTSRHEVFSAYTTHFNLVLTMHVDSNRELLTLRKAAKNGACVLGYEDLNPEQLQVVERLHVHN